MCVRVQRVERSYDSKLLMWESNNMAHHIGPNSSTFMHTARYKCSMNTSKSVVNLIGNFKAVTAGIVEHDVA
jgi:hypothetical protein